MGISGYFGGYLIFAFFARMLNAREKVHELLFHVQIVKQVIYFLPMKKK